MSSILNIERPGAVRAAAAASDVVPANLQMTDVQATFADISDLTRDVGFRPSTDLEDGIHRFAAWYCRYHRIN